MAAGLGPPRGWRVLLPGQPPSGNHMYERNRGNPGQHKKQGVEDYQAGVTLLVREARPSGWRPEGQIIIRYWFFLSRDVDCTNAIKVIEDAIAMALRPEDRLYDQRFLPRAMKKQVGTKFPGVWIELEPV